VLKESRSAALCTWLWLHTQAVTVGLAIRQREGCPGFTVAGTSDLGILADTPFERRVSAVHDLPSSGIPTLTSSILDGLDHSKGVRYAELFQGLAAFLERYHHRPAWIHDEPEALMQGQAFGLDSLADHGTTSGALLNVPLPPLPRRSPDAAASFFIHSVNIPLQSCLAPGPHRGRYSGQRSIATRFRSSAGVAPAMGTRPRGGNASES
jgi:hypothetical protein